MYTHISAASYESCGTYVNGYPTTLLLYYRRICTDPMGSTFMPPYRMVPSYIATYIYNLRGVCRMVGYRLSPMVTVHAVTL
ncbi:hypothetical protein [Veillonella magna]|uniref:hypothetical protein n=1 Tax=Veillonella magna TaxID=464322 RepID=UPI0023F1EF47|nr:hypothetical protein [Veillonella magna]